ncbi:MAG: hypothetical protein U0U66_14765 [Cytophagaceae bacterium]
MKRSVILLFVGFIIVSCGKKVKDETVNPYAYNLTQTINIPNNVVAMAILYDTNSLTTSTNRLLAIKSDNTVDTIEFFDVSGTNISNFFNPSCIENLNEAWMIMGVGVGTKLANTTYLYNKVTNEMIATNDQIGGPQVKGNSSYPPSSNFIVRRGSNSYYIAVNRSSFGFLNKISLTSTPFIEKINIDTVTLYDFIVDADKKFLLMYTKDGSPFKYGIYNNDFEQIYSNTTIQGNNLLDAQNKLLLDFNGNVKNQFNYDGINVTLPKLGQGNNRIVLV